MKRGAFTLTGVEGANYCLKVFPNQGEPYDIRLYEGYTILSDESAEQWYLYQKEFWEKREHQAEHDRQEVVQDYIKAFTDSPSRTEITEHIKQLNPASIIDFGGAVGGLYNALDDYGIRYTNIEPFAPFVERQLEDYPWTKGVVMDAAGFAETFGTDERYELFFASVSLCMVSPLIAKAVLEKASQIADNIVIWDFGLNMTGEISKDPVLYSYAPNTPIGFNFAHQFQTYLEDLGMVITHKKPTADFGAIWGHYIIQAEE